MKGFGNPHKKGESFFLESVNATKSKMTPDTGAALPSWGDKNKTKRGFAIVFSHRRVKPKVNRKADTRF